MRKSRIPAIVSTLKSTKFSPTDNSPWTRRAAIIICARRACLSRSFRSAIRLAVSFVHLDRNHSAARSCRSKGGCNFKLRSASMIALLEFLAQGKSNAAGNSAGLRRPSLARDHPDRDAFTSLLRSASSGPLASGHRHPMLTLVPGCAGKEFGTSQPESPY